MHWARLEASALGSLIAACPAWKRREKRTESTDAPRGTWPLGKIVSVHPGKDGHVRVVQVQVGQTTFTRPATALCSLECTE